jgi:FHS family glucose/mannose:H+ symporter-like MFS transporter
MNQVSPALEALPGQRTLSSLVLGAGFALTGAGTVMLGVLLPVLAQQWGLRDDAAGWLFFLQFVGSSLGAVLSGANRARSLKIGYGLLVVSALALAFTGLHLSFVVFFFFGLGLGMAMTSTSLLFSDRYGDDRAAVLERINFTWSAGATAGTILFVPFLRAADPRPLFFTFHGLFLALFIWALLRERQQEPDDQTNAAAPQTPSSAPLLFLLPLVVLAICSIGIESSLSGWLTMYSHRADPRVIGGVTLATSLFWLGMMGGRLAFSTRLLAMVGRERVLGAAIWGAAASVALLIAAPNLALIRVAAGLAGLCVGPLYPLLLSFLLERSPRGWILGASGTGAALFPWLTGLLSAHYGSLRFGLIAPCGAALLMILLHPICLRPARPAILTTPISL